VGIRDGFITIQNDWMRAAMRLPASWRKRVCNDAVWRAVAERPARMWFDQSLQSGGMFRMVREVADSAFPVGMSDAEICAAAEARAVECDRLVKGSRDEGRAVEACEAVAVRFGVDTLPLRAGWHPPMCAFAPMLSRYTCPVWWRRRIRRAVASRLEAAAISFGFVHRREYGGAYVSKESYSRWQQSQARNARTLKAVAMANEETGEIATLAELSAASVSNPNLRRGELMTRIRGFEEIAAREGHKPLFITLTCPSRMHARMSASGEQNPRYDGTKPDEAQAYLCALWARIRASLKRVGVPIYGFRVCEPHHDGCPHWHMLFFVPDGDLCGYTFAEIVCSQFYRYGLEDSPAEYGAAKHRVVEKKLDGSAGAASSYIAKYIAKGVGTLDADDLFDGVKGDEQKPRAWASTWRIRQFQQIGGPPVGLWRELRRVSSDEVPVDAPEQLALAWWAVQRDGERKACWRTFVDACGGWSVTRRTAALSLVREAVPGFTRYKEARPDAPVGVACGSQVARSTRDAWAVISRTWSRVNNCTAEFLAWCARRADNLAFEVGGAAVGAFNGDLRRNFSPGGVVL
jgi:Bacteriophage replication gene A protein (GPA)